MISYIFRGCSHVQFLNSCHRFFSSDFKSGFVNVTKNQHLHLIGINRPLKKNCVNMETARELKIAFQNFAADTNAFVAVLYGEGGTFCAGYDLQEIASGNVTELSIYDGPMGPTKMEFSKPVVAAINGYAVAGGLELALWCDLRIMEETAILGAFCRRFGVPLIDGGTVRLPALIGLSRSLDLILTGRGVSAKEAFEMGLVTKVCKKGNVLEEAINLAVSLCSFPQENLKNDKNSTYSAIFNAGYQNNVLEFDAEKEGAKYKF